MGAVIGDEERMVAVRGGGELHATVCGLSVAHDVCDCFANRQAEHGLFRGAELGQRRFARQCYACCLQGVAGEFHFGGQALGTIATDGLAYFAEGRSGGSFRRRRSPGRRVADRVR